MPYGGMPGGMQGPKPSSNLVWGILTTIFCCLPFGIVSIVYAAKVDGLYNGGQYAAAVEASGKARTWAIIAAVVGLIVGLGWAGITFLAGANT